MPARSGPWPGRPGRPRAAAPRGAVTLCADCRRIGENAAQHASAAALALLLLPLQQQSRHRPQGTQAQSAKPSPRAQAAWAGKPRPGSPEERGLLTQQPVQEERDGVGERARDEHQHPHKPGEVRTDLQPIALTHLRRGAPEVPRFPGVPGGFKISISPRVRPPHVQAFMRLLLSSLPKWGHAARIGIRVWAFIGAVRASRPCVPARAPPGKKDLDCAPLAARSRQTTKWPSWKLGWQRWG